MPKTTDLPQSADLTADTLVPAVQGGQNKALALTPDNVGSAVASSTTPVMDGAAAVGTSKRLARADHVHPTDTTLAPKASPTFTGTPAAPTAAADTNTTQIATTAFVLGQASSSNPVIDGTAAAGSSTRFARADHVHPTDTSRAPLASPAFTGTPTAPTAALGTNTTQVATTAFVKAAVDAGGGGGGASFPTQTGKGGYALHTDGSAVLWVGPAPVLNVKAPPYSLAGDGSTDDTTAMDAAVAFAGSNEVRLLFPAGVYKRTTPLMLQTDELWLEGAVPVAVGRGPTDSPARDNDCAVIRCVTAGTIPVIVGKNIDSSGVGSGRDLLYRPVLKNLRIEGAADAPLGVKVWHAYHGIFEGLHIIGPYGDNRILFGSYADVDCTFEAIEVDGLGVTAGVVATLAGAAAIGFDFGFGYQVDTPTTRVLRKLYAHYVQKAARIGGAADVYDSILESCLDGLELTENCRVTLTNTYTENIVNEGADFIFGKNAIVAMDGWEGLIYASGRTKGMKGANISSIIGRNLKPQFNQTSTPALFDSSLNLYGNVFSDGTAGNNVANAIAQLQVLCNKEGMTLGGGAGWTADKLVIEGMQLVPYDFTVSGLSQYYVGTLAAAPSGFGDSDGYFVPRRCHVVGVQVLLGTNLAYGSFDIDVKTNESGSFVATKIMDDVGTVGTKRDYTKWIKPYTVKLEEGHKIEVDFIANTIDATATHKIRVWTIQGPDGRGQMKY